MLNIWFMIFLLSGMGDIDAVDTVKVTTPRTIIPPRPANALTEIFPQRVINRIAKADSVECVLLNFNPDKAGGQVQDQYDLFLSQYDIRERGGYLTDEDRKELLSILLDPNRYVILQIGDSKPCATITGETKVAYLFTTLGTLPEHLERTVVFYCASCAKISVRCRGNSISADIDYENERLKALSWALFPADSLLSEIYSR
jgi:hypothetical protein